MVAKKLLHLFGFSTTLRLQGKCLLNKTQTIGQGFRNVQGVLYIFNKFRELWPTNGLKVNRSFYPPSVFCSVPSPSQTL